MNITARLQLERIQPDLAAVAEIQEMIRFAVIEDNELSAKYLDKYLTDNPEQKVAALYIAQNLYNIRRLHP